MWLPRVIDRVYLCDCLETREAQALNPSQSPEKLRCPPLDHGGRKKGTPPPSFTFRSFQALNGWNDARPYWERQSTESIIQMLISSGNTLKDNIHKQKTVFSISIYMAHWSWCIKLTTMTLYLLKYLPRLPFIHGFFFFFFFSCFSSSNLLHNL